MKIILGTMTFSGQVDEALATDMVSEFKRSANDEVDTAFVYNKGETEKLLGRIHKVGALEGTRLAGKANPKALNGLSPESVRKQMLTSLERLQMESFDLFYLHSPDLDIPVHDTLQAIAHLHDEGKFKRFGLSNYAAWQVAEIIELCNREGWIAPSVYQGMYNALTRDVERELFACLSNYNVSFYAYNPLAGGMLSGKHQSLEQLPDEGRFATFDGYQDRYWKPEYFKVINEISDTCKTADIAPAAAAIRWLIHHSALTDNSKPDATDTSPAQVDHGLILGASSMTHLQQNIRATLDGPLPQELVDAIESGWMTVRPACIKYFRP
ncbi:MAG: aldo/keto reductase family protein [Granulosicoccus sp.]